MSGINDVVRGCVSKNWVCRSLPRFVFCACVCMCVSFCFLIVFYLCCRITCTVALLFLSFEAADSTVSDVKSVKLFFIRLHPVL